VFQNMALSLKIRRVGKEEMQRRVQQAARILRLEHLLSKRPRELSGGERQRVAMGRAIVRQPQAFLMDEPLSNLDAKLRVQMRSEILRIQRDLRVTTLYVTHDQTEAMTLGDRVAVLKRGVLQQVDRPQALYREPVNLFVAGFVGSPAMNMVEATLVESGGDWLVAFGPHRLQVPAEVRKGRPALAGFLGRRVLLGIRPEDLEDAALAGGAPPDSRFPATIDLREEMGSEVFIHFVVHAPPVHTEDIKELAVDRGSEVLQELEEQVSKRRTPFVARVNPETSAEVGETREFSVDTRKLYFFDPHTGDAIHGGGGEALVRSPGASSREMKGA
jgi:multiple sugar transport system ATP-binding protein